MNPSLVCLCFVLISWRLAAAACSDIEVRLNMLEQQLKQGYRLNELPKLQRQQQLLSSRLQNCLDQQQAKSVQSKNTPPAKSGDLSQLAKGRAFSSSHLLLTAPYQGEQQQAWLKFYREPALCYGVRDTAQIAWCAEQRQQAKLQFDRQWQQKLAKSPPK
ncbi:hypothetical protein [Rheinheimera sp.]|uniref:hypothetical protein n=1 Tax=Rheinheimera sp. TaxID=1869214 RepID=UPI00307CED30